MIEKAILTKEQAEALEKLKSHYESLLFNPLESIIRAHISIDSDWEGRFESINDLLLDKLIRALYIGYEVEQTPEEKVREYYEDQLKKEVNASIKIAKRQAVCHTLNLLGIKIEGVNDHATPTKDEPAANCQSNI